MTGSKDVAPARRGGGAPGWRRRVRRVGGWVLGVGFVLVAVMSGLHLWIGARASLTPPKVKVPSAELRRRSGTLGFGESFVVRRGALREVHLRGSPEEIGYAHARLLRDEMVKNEGVLYGALERYVPTRLLRALLLDVAQWQYSTVDLGMDSGRKLEIAAQALGFQPDPYRSWFDTYQRFVYLSALYDISLSFEYSPLIGCTTFSLLGDKTKDGHVLLARAFDFEVSDIFDSEKAVFFVEETGMIPFASVAWPGLVGVVSGMNVDGLAVVVHGGRAGEPARHGEPVVHALRRALGTCRNTAEAVAALAAGEPMVSHIVIVTDALGDTRVLERVPGRLQHDYRLPGAAVVTNHFIGPSADDPKNQRVRRATSTLARAASGSRALKELEGKADAADAVRLLRDRRSGSGAPLELGDRAAIDALIATHGVVMDATDRVLWVSEGPHLLGRFVAFNLPRHFTSGADAPVAFDEALDTVPADPLLTSGAYARWKTTQVPSRFAPERSSTQ